jgi:hypothetical protein
MTQESKLKEQATDVYNMLAAVRIKDGATKWMKERGYYMDNYPESIDGMTGKISGDYTSLCGDDKHYAVDITNYVNIIGAVGVNPMFLETV